ncbi:Translin [Fomitiporia mediterranea MF3/22]|uniref:Translin n=1 Tax=Fomitiporia mediterranea (strain MF3/22) TaxID=694068 RepID=UPI0004407932|nr:Translin [Fomitiporia mediterranea MF3/22]EJC98116.1 Translin [Fomitiporia mediterranea MF3/22]
MDQVELDHLNSLLDRDVEIKEKLKDTVQGFEKRTRSIVGLLNKIHGTPSDAIPSLVDGVRPMFNGCAESIATIAELIPENEYWRWSNMWTNTLRSAVFAVAFVEYLDSGNLLSQSGISEVLGVKEDTNTRMMIQAEDYLHGLISLVNELSRWAVNAVTLGDFERPIRISIFVKNVFAGFSMLNLKNDSLRRRFDSLKYDIKKIEEVVYDVSLRKLADPKGVVICEANMK